MTFNKVSEKNYNLRNIVGNDICFVIYSNSLQLIISSDRSL